MLILKPLVITLTFTLFITSLNSQTNNQKIINQINILRDNIDNRLYVKQLIPVVDKNNKLHFEEGKIDSTRKKSLLSVLDSLLVFFHDSSNFYNDSLIISCSFIPNKVYALGKAKGNKTFFFLSETCTQLIVCHNDLTKIIAHIRLKQFGFERIIKILNDS